MMSVVALVLASSSPRRADLLTAAGFRFIVVPADVDETARAQETPEAYASRVATDKAARVARDLPAPTVVLAADTVVVAGGRLMGKPRTAEEAASMLGDLSGREHDVHTAVVVQCGARRLDEVATTRVRFVRMSPEDIAWYVRSGEPFGKAGAYGIQGRAARFIDRIEGSWSNVVGLPLATVHRLLEEIAQDAGPEWLMPD
jgi:septum formation protein